MTTTKIRLNFYSSSLYKKKKKDSTFSSRM